MDEIDIDAVNLKPLKGCQALFAHISALVRDDFRGDDHLGTLLGLKRLERDPETNRGGQTHEDTAEEAAHDQDQSQD